MTKEQKELIARFQTIVKEYDHAKQKGDKKGMEAAQAKSLSMVDELKNAGLPFEIKMTANQNSKHFTPGG